MGSENQNPLRTLAQDLLREPFALKRAFAQCSIEGVAQLLESEPQLEPGSPFDQSFERCKAVFCLLLLELENVPELTLHQTVAQLASGSGETAPAAQAAVPLAVAQPSPPAASGKAGAGAEGLAAPPKVHPLTEQYLGLAKAVRSLGAPPGFMFTATTVRRLELQQLCLALELECQAKLATGLAQFWPQRMEALKLLMVPSQWRNDFPEAIKKMLARIAQEHPTLLYEGKLSTVSLGNTLRYLQAVPSSEPLRPSVMESASLIFFFAQPQPSEGGAIANRLMAQGLDATKTLELALRLCRVQKQWGLAFDPSGPLEEKKEALLREDIRECFSLLERLQTGVETALKKTG